MSNLCRRMAKPKKVCARKIRQEQRRHCTKQYTSFNISYRQGENLVVHTQRPMTEVEAQYIYGALSISGIE